jgi:membrane-associated HD superfamily phosphohydrolase
MSEKTVVITEKESKYEIQNRGISELALIGILECLLFDLKSARRAESFISQPKEPQEPKQDEIPQKPNKESSGEAYQTEIKATAQEKNTSDLRTRIGNAIKAIQGLGGNIEETDLSNLTDQELQDELEELTNQYKRLKSSKGASK